jgi:hypothetical protein
VEEVPLAEEAEAEEARPAEAEADLQGVELGAAAEAQEGADSQAAQDVASAAEAEGKLDRTRRWPRLPSKTIDDRFYLSLSFSVAYRTKRCCLLMYYFTLLYFTLLTP